MDCQQVAKRRRFDQILGEALFASFLLDERPHPWIRFMRVAVARLAAPFASWKAHECEAATRGIMETFAPAPTALGQINAGMLRLFRLVELPPPSTEGR
jgi:hypothetical protein